jgi:hypothetical protein
MGLILIYGLVHHIFMWPFHGIYLYIGVLEIVGYYNATLRVDT